MLNKTQLIGYLGKDVDMRVTQDGTAVANFSLATSEHYKDKATGEKKSQTEWHRVVLFGRTAEIARDYLKKGSMAYIEGKLRTRQWEKDGVKHNTTEIVGNELKLLDRRADSDNGQQTSQANGNGGNAKGKTNGGNGYSNGKSSPAASGKGHKSGVTNNLQTSTYDTSGFDDDFPDIPF
jgi:single-strand DNA-binding protein